MGSGMDGETVQTTRIEKDEYLRFKQWVQDVHGTTRGHLKTEIENALREYRQPDNTSEPIHRIEQDIATIKAQLADAESDGGVAPTHPNEDTHTHTPNTGGSKPNPNAPRQKKVEWVIDQNYDRDGGTLTADVVIDDVKSEFSFEDRTAKKYVQDVIDELGAKEHPNNSTVLVWGDVIGEVRENVDDK